MRRDVTSGILLILGAIIGFVVMHAHPVSHQMLDAPNTRWMATLNVLVHGAAIASVPMLLLGLWGLTRRLAPSALTVPALVVHATGSVAILCAAVMSGFVATDVIERLAGADPAAHDLYDALLTYTGIVNRGFATVFVVASSVAILLWSVAILRTGRLQRAVGLVGIVVASLVLVAFLGGVVGLDVRGFGFIIVAHAVWLTWIGILLLREDPGTSGT